MTIDMFIKVDEKEINRHLETLKDGNSFIGDRFHSLFSARTYFTTYSEKAEEFVVCLSESLLTSTPLLQHELCYILGQYRNPSTRALQITLLENVIFGDFEDIVRHEAVEALGALGGSDALSSIIDVVYFDNDPCHLVKETCELAIGKYNHEQSNGKIKSYFNAIDPTPAHTSRNIKELEHLLIHGNSLFEKYSAIFALRDTTFELLNGTTKDKAIIINCNETISVQLVINTLSKGFSDSSALLRHEIAYVFGQLSILECYDSLCTALGNKQEHPIVRHECAEAIGSIGKIDILKDYLDDKDEIVKESCLVGLKMGGYSF